MTTPDPKATAQTRKRYQRVAPFYDLMEILPERKYAGWRKQLWSQIKGPKILEVGVGTGKNIPYYPDNAEITAIDLTPGMLKQAQKKAEDLGVTAKIQLGDAQKLDFPDNTFDTVLATFVFCSVPDPVLGMQEMIRVAKPNGQIFLLEHMRADNVAIGFLMDILNPLIVRTTGVNINRKTVSNAHKANLKLNQIQQLGMNGIFKRLDATKDE